MFLRKKVAIWDISGLKLVIKPRIWPGMAKIRYV